MFCCGILSAGATVRSASIDHSPKTPISGQRVAISASLPEFKSAVLQVQTVKPGSYIRKTDRTFETSWKDLPMEKHGETFVASIPSEFQSHRHLVRYRIKGTSAIGGEVFLPARTNLVPNFAYFVYDGLPAWTGASRPGRTPSLTFTPDFLTTLPTYHLIANERDVTRSQWDHGANRQPFSGTLVFNGQVYDHIQFHNRGQASTYVAGKNKWGIKFNRGDSFNVNLPNARGQRYQYKWSGMNLNPCASAWAPVNRGMAGMDEALSYRVYQLAGVPSPDTFWIQFRVIDNAEENPKSQYDSDLWGLYLVVQEKNAAWLRENALLDGNIFNPESGPKHHAPGAPDPTTDYSKFRNGSSPRQSEGWWEKHLDLPRYYSFHAVNRFVANIDLRPSGNHYLYHHPGGRWIVLPHDLDMMLIPKHHQPGFVPQSYSLEHPKFRLAYKNRAREILDLLASDASENGGQIGQLVAELSSKIAPPGHQQNWAALDEAMWNHHPRSHHRGQFNVTPYSDHRMGGHWERVLSTPDFAGFCKYILEFCTDSRPEKNFRPNDGNQLGYGYEYLAYEARDRSIPDRPTINSSDFKTFTVSPFSSPANAAFAAIQWRVSEIAAPGLDGFQPGEPYRYEIESGWTVESNTNQNNLRLPASAIAPDKTFRIRARYRDDTGRWSHWSAPIQFVAPTG